MKFEDALDRCIDDCVRVLHKIGKEEIDILEWHRMIDDRLDVLLPNRPQYQRAVGPVDEEEVDAEVATKTITVVKGGRK